MKKKPTPPKVQKWPELWCSPGKKWVEVMIAYPTGRVDISGLDTPFERSGLSRKDLISVGAELVCELKERE
jgi:hypothetical protein